MATLRNIFTKLGFKVDTSGIDAAEKSVKKYKAEMQKLAAVGAVIAGGLAYASKKAGDFDYAMAEVSTLVDTSTVDMGKLNTQMLALARQFGEMPVDMAKSLYTTISAGFGDASQATMLLEASLKLAKGGVTTTQIAVNGLTTALNSYGLDASHSTDISDAMFVAMKAGKTTIEELATGMGMVTPMASALNIPLHELLALTSALTLGGLKTDMSFTSLRATLSAILSPSTAALGIAKKYKFEMSASAVKAMGLANWLKLVKERVGDNQEAMAKLFPNVRALTGVLALVGKQAGKVSQIMGQMDNRTGQTEIAYKKISKTAAATFKRMHVSIVVLATTIGKQLLPMLAKMFVAVSRVVNNIQGFSEAHPLLTKVIAVMYGLLSVILLVGGALTILTPMVALLTSETMIALAPIYLMIIAITLALGLWLLIIDDIICGFTGGKSAIIDSLKLIAGQLWWLLGVAWDVGKAIASPLIQPFIDAFKFVKTAMSEGLSVAWEEYLNEGFGKDRMRKLGDAAKPFLGRNIATIPGSEYASFDPTREAVARSQAKQNNIVIGSLQTTIEGSTNMTSSEVTDATTQGVNVSLQEAIKELNYSTEGAAT